MCQLSVRYYKESRSLVPWDTGWVTMRRTILLLYIPPLLWSSLLSHRCACIFQNYSMSQLKLQVGRSSYFVSDLMSSKGDKRPQNPLTRLILPWKQSRLVWYEDSGVVAPILSWGQIWRTVARTSMQIGLQPTAGSRSRTDSRSPTYMCSSWSALEVSWTSNCLETI